MYEFLCLCVYTFVRSNYSEYKSNGNHILIYLTLLIVKAVFYTKVLNSIFYFAGWIYVLSASKMFHAINDGVSVHPDKNISLLN